MKRYLVASVVAMVLAGCGPATLDGSSNEAMQESTKAVKESLSAQEQARFEASLQTILMDRAMPGGSALAAARMDSGQAAADLMRELDGKSAEQVIAMADSILAERRARELVQMQEEIQELTAKKEKADQAKLELEKFEVIRSRFRMQEQRFGSPKPVIELTVRNGTDVAISRAYFVGTIASPGRAVPWLKEEFNYPIRGGLEPGEEVSWSLTPNMFSSWGNVNAPDDAVLTVEVLRLDGPDGEPAFDSRFSERDAARLDLLQKRLTQG